MGKTTATAPVVDITHSEVFSNEERMMRDRLGSNNKRQRSGSGEEEIDPRRKDSKNYVFKRAEYF